MHDIILKSILKKRAQKCAQNYAQKPQKYAQIFCKIIVCPLRFKSGEENLDQG